MRIPLVKCQAGILGIIFILFSSSFAFSEELVITTYYPSPYGSYNELTAYKTKVGDSYAGASVDTDNLVVEGRVGIGTTSPIAQLQVKGSGATDWISLDVSSGTVNISSGSTEAVYVNAGGSSSGQYFNANDFRSGALTLGYQVSPFITTEANKDLTINAGGIGKTIIQDDLGIRKTPQCSLDVEGTIRASGNISVNSASANSVSAGSITITGDITANNYTVYANRGIGINALCIGNVCRTSWPTGGACPGNHTSHRVVYNNCAWSTPPVSDSVQFRCPVKEVLAGRQGVGESGKIKYKCCSLRVCIPGTGDPLCI